MVTKTTLPRRAGTARGSTTVRMAEPRVATTRDAPQAKTIASITPSTGAAYVAPGGEQNGRDDSGRDPRHLGRDRRRGAHPPRQAPGTAAGLAPGRPGR